MNATHSRLGVCSWSLLPSNVDELIERIAATGLSSVQLALDPLRTLAWPPDTVFAKLADAGIEVLSGMMQMPGEDYASLQSIRETGGVRLDEFFPLCLQAARANAELCREFRIPLMTFHAGFIPHDSADPIRGVMLDRIAQLVAVFREFGVKVALETGQETAETLNDALAQLPEDVGVNFDPANMILYGMGNPVAALEALAPRVFQVHLKDAVASTSSGEWGTEVRVGDGEVEGAKFLRALQRLTPDVDLVIEREAGDQRVEDVCHAVGRLKEWRT